MSGRHSFHSLLARKLSVCKSDGISWMPSILRGSGGGATGRLWSPFAKVVDIYGLHVGIMCGIGPPADPHIFRRWPMMLVEPLPRPRKPFSVDLALTPEDKQAY